MKARDVRQAGFTLVELMVVVAIIGILATIALPQLTKYMKTSETSEPAQVLGDIAKNIQAFVDSRPNILNTTLQTALSGAVLKGEECTAATCLNTIISQLALPATSSWNYKVHSITISQTTRLATFCLAAQKTASTALGVVLYSSSPTTSVSWEGQFHRASYISSSDTFDIPAGGACATGAASSFKIAAAT